MIEAWSEKIAISIKNANEEHTASIPLMKFALIILFNFFIPTIISLLIGAMTGNLAETALSISSFVILRMASGGYHFKSSMVCMLTMIVIAVIPPLVPVSENWTLILTVVGLILVTTLAPSNMRGYNRMPEKYYPLLKTASVIFVASNLYIGSGVMALVFAIQGVSLFGFKEV